ncbi:alpha/beta hydrolase domain-containing protein [Klenkia sp. PcliD-1-E]|uniref:alpha/beta hydrolase domain-containing protein n=1 Tax=Klenkia sp. PcliD-1-E TaxID=2954492 RepID=UPI0020986267|nr:alpha/beta hydrolase domain-containing protein [Klenkia sp. PcliD-1-E]MCO7220505.1 alpha/beta hydrolase domain-containing protein [Klenkia sp. PcliD-1-E]
MRARELPVTPASVPLGAASVPGLPGGVDLTAHGYVEHEFLVTGDGWTTRVLTRRPADPARASGVLQVEALHPEFDTAATWRVLHPWVLRTGGAWLGITTARVTAASMREQFDPDRYADLDLPEDVAGQQLVAAVVRAVRTGELDLLGGQPVRRAHLSGWSMTGSFVRVFLGEGHHEAVRLPDGAPLLDGYVVGISSGGAGPAGYPPPHGSGEVPLDDPRRRVGGHDVPVVEVLSETESATHAPVLRPDSDEPGDRYRLYQVAGTAHDSTGPSEVLVNAAQYRARGLPTGSNRVVEERSRARLDLVARAVFAALDTWVAEGVPMPRADRFAFADASDRRIPDGARPLARDAVGNVLGGVRTPWVEAPLASYWPYATPVPGGCVPSPFAPPHLDAQVVADLVGVRTPLDPAPDRAARFAAATRALVEQRLLLPEDLPELPDPDNPGGRP